MSEPITSDGKRVVDNWLHAKERVQRAELALHDAKRDLRETEDALAKWMLPDDAKPGEKICVWYVDSLIQVEVPEAQPPMAVLEGEAQPTPPRPIITTRLRGKHGLNRV